MLNLPKFLFLNGPPGSGKSTLAKLICDQNQLVWRESFAEPIRAMVYAVFFPEEGPVHYNLDLRSGETKAKEFPFQNTRPDEIGERNTFRATMISFSEDWMKPRFGDDIFGRLAFQRCLEQEAFYDHFIFDDCGFKDEVNHIVRLVSPMNCRLIRLHRTGYDFVGDSRGYIVLPGVETFDLHNDSLPEGMMAQLELEIGAL